MRLNRVLLLAATINIMVFALAFTISCSDGENGKTGPAGNHCVLNEDNGHIICNEKNDLGPLTGSGPGAPGANGKEGSGCWLVANGTSYDITCGTKSNNDVKGTLDGCTVETFGDYEIDITCGKEEKEVTITLCNGKIFDPKEDRCKDDGSTAALSESDIEYCGKDKKPYDKNKQYCAYAPGDEEGEPSVVATACAVKGAGDTKLEPNKTFASEGKEYCQVTKVFETDTKTAIITKETCPDKQRINENDWKGEYCGYSSGAKTMTKQTGACDRAGTGKKSDGSSVTVIGPNQIAFNQGYCTVPVDEAIGDNGKIVIASGAVGKKGTIYTEAFCGGNNNLKPNNGKWSDEYCAYNTAGSVRPDKVSKGVCNGDRKGPDSEKYQGGFCGYKNKADFEAEKKTVLSFCGTGKDKYNENTWRDYCGYEGESATEKTKLYKADAVGGGLCDGKEGALTTPVGAYSDIKSNLGDLWGGYCQFSMDGTTGVITSKLIKRAVANFCNSSLTELPSSLTGTSGDTALAINIGSWKWQYCPASGAKKGPVCDNGKGPSDKEYCAYTFASNLKTVVQKECGDGSKPNEGEFKSGAWKLKGSSAAPSVKFGYWKAEYCGFDKGNDGKPVAGTKLKTGACNDGGAPYDSTAANAPADITSPTENWDGYCQWSTKNATGTVLVAESQRCVVTAVTPSVKKTVNEGSWKNEYCKAAPNNETPPVDKVDVRTCNGGTEWSDLKKECVVPSLPGGGGEPAVTYDLQCPTGIGSVSAETGDDKSAIEPEVICKPSNAAGVAVASANLSWTAVKDGASDPVALVWNSVEEGVFTTITAKATSGNCNNKTVVCSGTLTVTDP